MSITFLGTYWNSNAELPCLHKVLWNIWEVSGTVCGGGGGNRTRVPKTELIAFYKFSQIIMSRQYHFVHWHPQVRPPIW